jgi:hypothetical protein
MGMKDFLFGNKEQRKNSRSLFYDFLLIFGAMFFSQGILAIVPQEWIGMKEWGALGLILIIIAVSASRIDGGKL